MLTTGAGGATERASASPLRVLLIEDSEADALLLLRELRRGGYETAWERVDTAAALSRALERSWDVITCDWKMPGFGAPEALALIRDAAVDTPVIIVSGEVGEEFAVTAMRAGACDFVSKQRLARLAPAIDRELRDAEQRRARRRAEAALRAAQERYRALIENASDQVAVLDANGIYQYVSPSHVDVCGFTPEELLGTSAFELVHPDDLPALATRLKAGLRERQSYGVAEFRVRHKDGSWRVIETAVQNLLDDPLIRGVLINGRDVTARRRMEDTLRLQAAIIANLAEGVALVRASDRTIVHTNPKLEEMFGYGPGELLGQPASVLELADAASDAADDVIARALRERGEWSGEARNRRRDGSELWTRVSISTFDHPDHGEVWITIQSDIGEQKRVDAALRQSEEHMRLAMGAAPMGTWEWDLTSGTMHWSDSVWQMLGLSRERTRPSLDAFLSVVHRDDRAMVLRRIDTALDDDVPAPTELRIVWSDGSVRWVLAHSRVVRDAAGRAIRTVGIALDITERRRAQADLEHERELLATLIRSLPDMVWMKDPEGVFLACNAAFERMVGRPQAAIVGHTDLELLADPELARFFREKDREALAKGSANTNDEWVTLAADGRRVLLETIKTPVRDAGGAVLGVLGIGRDVTQHREREELLRQRVALQTQLEKVAATSPGMICSFRLHPDGSSSLPYASAAMRDIWDLDPAVVRDDAAPVFARIHPDDVARVHASIADSARGMTPWQEVFRVLNPRRGERWVEAHTMPAREDDGSVLWHGIAIDVTERRHLEEQAARWRTVFDAAQIDAAWADAATNTVVAVNTAFARRRGYRPDELVGLPVAALHPPEERAALPARLQRIDRLGHLTYETVHQRKDGTRFPVLMDVTAIRDDAGAVASRVAYALDLSELRRAEEQVRISDSRYRALFANMLDGCALCRLVRVDGVPRDFLHLEVNEACTRLTGISDVVGRTASEVVPELLTLDAAVFDTYARVVATGQAERFETYLRSLRIWVTASVYAAGGDDFIVVFDNVTEAKEAHVRTAIQTTALRAAANAIVITDRGGAIVWANPAFTRLTGYELGEVLGRNPRLLKSGVQDAPFYARIWQTITAGDVWEGQVVNRRKDGSLYTEEMTITPVRGDGDAITHFIAVKQDVTERQRAEEERRRLHGELEQRVAERTGELEAANRELEAFSYSVSHDLRAPLRSIRGFSQALLDDFASQLPGEARAHLATIQGAAERMGALIDALLNLSRLGRQALLRRPVDMARLVREVLADLQPLAVGRAVEVALGALPPGDADPTLLRQVWLNLLSNAFKYTTPRAVARIEIGSRREQGEVVYFVRDNGAGFDMGYVDRLFGVFKRLHSQSEFEGTGVGLAIVQRIVHRHGGRVWAEAAPDQGATFSFTLGRTPAGDPTAPGDALD
ncbi:PAS domain S-box protein [bacterium]|nr:PAS domain S-box protein [bacterium]